ncbi:hypothetical protein [Arenicella xantha]|uniref:TonB-like protein n=1 Tax=Arenicella xantha TaxID=644221 RepID=A0A395JK34_9GAMM|nr:hypothetical protein [Arenicella xantha]RBP51143.1 hypothetical protein DFR28_102562 [Arenicella xantha]
MSKISLFSLLIVSAFCITTVNARDYFIYGDKREGTKFREVVYTWPVSLKKKYARLAEAEKQIVRASYPNLNEGDTPPYPKKGVIKILKPYVNKFRWFGDDTSGLLLADIGVDGRATKVRTKEWVRPEIVRYMATVLHKIQFDPALCSGVPCAMTFQIELLPIENPIRNNEIF